MLILITNLIVLGLSLVVLALNLKLYTEILKDKAMNKRMKPITEEQES